MTYRVYDTKPSRRKNVSYTLDIDVINRLRRVHFDTRIPLSRLVEEAVVDLVNKYENKK